jgi:hypothetical protein
MITIRQAPELINGFCHYSIRAMGSQYKNKQLMNDLKMCWVPESKTWEQSGYVRTTAERTEKYLVNKIKNKIPADDNLAVEVVHEEGLDDHQRQN